MTDVLIIDDVIENQILPKLREIDDLSVLDGYLIHYAKDLLDGKNGLSFPCVAVQHNVEKIEPKSDNTSGKVTGTLQIIGAVNTEDRSKVRRSLNLLAHTVRAKLAVNKFNKKNKEDRSITYSNCVYETPDSKDSYALFVMDISIDITENWTE